MLSHLFVAITYFYVIRVVKVNVNKFFLICAHNSSQFKNEFLEGTRRITQLYTVNVFFFIDTEMKFDSLKKTYE